MGWQLQAVPILIAGNTYIDSTGVYIYNGTPAAGNPPLIAETAPGITQDPFGNSIQPGDALSTGSFIVLGSGNSFLQIAVRSGLASLLLGTGDASETAFGFLDSVVSGAGGTRQLLTELESPSFGGNPASIQLVSQSQDGTVNSAINLNSANRVNLGVAKNAWWADGTQQLNLPASGGPFIFGESFHDVSGGSGNTCRVKKVPWSGVWLDFEGSWAGVATTNMGTLPDSTYYPTQARHIPVSSNAAAAQNAAIFIPTSGNIQIVTKGGAGAGAGGCSAVYPTN